MLTIENASILLGPELEHIERGYIRIDSGAIVDAGPGKSGGSGKRLDAGGFLVIPGFINAHTHVADSIGKDIAAGKRLDARVHPVFGAKKTILEKSAAAHLQVFVRSSAVSMLQKGITAFADFREGGPQGVRLLKDAVAGLPIKCVVLGRADHYSDPSGTEGLPPQAIAKAREVLKIADGLGISGANENTDTALAQYGEMAAGKIVAIHAAESKEAAEFSMQHTGRSEVERIIGHLKPDIVVHATNATDSDISLVAGRAGVVVCPRANGVLGAGLPRVAEMMRRGCQIAIGTDNVMLNSPDMFRELDYLWKASHAAGEFIEPRELIKMATVNAARMLGLDSGSIEAGKAADLVVIDTKHADLYPVHDPYAAVVHRAGPGSVAAVMVNGRFAIPGVFQ
ncbi:MAG: amidohydrolase family protein [Nitrososphaera sp.]|uniref:amidohydrolase family protein n=1 Tax=Nitrososphaera sp. TaxID=1971748 RepID=UPI003D6F36F6